jgi:hypothetical protein
MQWSAYEDSILDMFYPVAGAIGCKMLLLHRTLASIRHRALDALGINVMPRWTDQEDQTISTLYVTGGADAVIQQLPHRTRSSIINRAMRLNIKYSPLKITNIDHSLYRAEQMFLYNKSMVAKCNVSTFVVGK